MNRHISSGHRAANYVPRRSGDEPGLKAPEFGEEECSPQERG